MFKMEEMISQEEKVVMVGMSKGYTKRNFSKTDLMKAKRLASKGTSSKNVVCKNSTKPDKEGKWLKEAIKQAEKAKEFKSKKAS